MLHLFPLATLTAYFSKLIKIRQKHMFIVPSMGVKQKINFFLKYSALN